MPDDKMDGLLERIRSEYNPPPETPREEMWSVIQGRIGEKQAEGTPEGPGMPSGGSPEATDERVVSLDQARQARRPRQLFVWALGAAAILVLGLGLGRMTAPGSSPSPKGGAGATSATAEARDSDLLRIVALGHLAKTESLLTLARADASVGGMEARVGDWSRGLLAQTRLIMDAQENPDRLLQELLEDLELVLVQLVGAAAIDGDPATVEAEWNLALDGLDDTEVLSRIRAVLPTGARFMGT